jgi:hypothetical protein
LADDITTLLSITVSNVNALQDLIELVNKAQRLGMPINSGVEVTGHTDSISITWGLYSLENQ